MIQGPYGPKSTQWLIRGLWAPVTLFSHCMLMSRKAESGYWISYKIKVAWPPYWRVCNYWFSWHVTWPGYLRNTPNNKKENFIPNRKVLVNLCDWINSFEAIWKNAIWRPSWNLPYRVMWLDPSVSCTKLCEFCSYEKILNELKQLELRFGKKHWNLFEFLKLNSHLEKWRITKLCGT